MRRIILKEARPGMVVARHLTGPADPANRIASSGDVLSASLLVTLHEAGVYDLWVSDPGLEFLDDMCATQTTRPQQRLAEALRESMLRFSNGVSRTLCRRHDITVEELLRSILRTAPVVPGLQALTEDEGLLSHSADVTVLSIYLGLTLETYLIGQRRRLNTRQARDIVNLALGALFHDAGEVMLPPAQRESRLLATGAIATSGDAWKQHTDEGYAMVRGKLDPSAAAVIQHHHQHFDGTGYSGVANNKALSGEGIHVFARIVMAADSFCQLHEAAGQMNQPMVKTLWKFAQPANRRRIDPAIFDGLVALIAPFPEGTIVTLNDDRLALVSKANPQQPCYPEVQIVRQGEAAAHAPTRINLAETQEVFIAAIAGSDVREFLTGNRNPRPLAAA